MGLSCQAINRVSNRKYNSYEGVNITILRFIAKVIIICVKVCYN